MMPCACAIGVTPEELEDIWDEEDGRELLLDRLVDIEFEERMQPQQELEDRERAQSAEAQAAAGQRSSRPLFLVYYDSDTSYVPNGVVVLHPNCYTVHHAMCSRFSI